MKKSVWIPMLAAGCVVAGAVAGAYFVMMKREKELAEYEQMLIRQDIPEAEWESEGETTEGETTEETIEAVEVEAPVEETAEG